MTVQNKSRDLNIKLAVKTFLKQMRFKSVNLTVEKTYHDINQKLAVKTFLKQVRFKSIFKNIYSF